MIFLLFSVFSVSHPVSTQNTNIISKTLAQGMILVAGADPGFQVRGGGAFLKKLRRAEGGAEIFGVFRVKIHDFTPKKNITECPSYP